MSYFDESSSQLYGSPSQFAQGPKSSFERVWDSIEKMWDNLLDALPADNSCTLLIVIILLAGLILGLRKAGFTFEVRKDETELRLEIRKKKRSKNRETEER